MVILVLVLLCITLVVIIRCNVSLQICCQGPTNVLVVVVIVIVVGTNERKSLSESSHFVTL